MYILLASATTLEIQPTTDFLEKAGFLVGDHAVGILTTGVGSMATLHSLMRVTLEGRPDLILQAGIAGTFAGKPAGEVLAVKEELPDLGVWEEGRFKSLFDLQLAGRDTPPFSDGMLINPYKKLLHLSALEPVRGLSVNEITTDPGRIRWLQQNRAPVVESMEGSALHYTCLMEGIPFLQIRAISNDVGIRDKTKWDIPGAVSRLNEEMISLLNKLAAADETILERSV